MLVPPATFGARGTSLINTINNLGLSSGLKLCLDAGDLNSYDGSSQTWKDLSGNGADFNRGTGSGSDAADPTFAGVAGRQSLAERFSYDGADFFTLASANPSWVDACHKANATFTVAAWQYMNAQDAVTDNGGRLGTLQTNTQIGFQLGTSAASLRKMGIGVANGSGTVYTKVTSASIVNNAWNFIAISVDMTTGTVIFNINGTGETYTGQAYTSPSSSPATNVLEIGAVAGVAANKSGCLERAISMWSVARSDANLQALYAATKEPYL